MSTSGAPGADLVVAPGPGLPDGLTIGAGDLVERFSKSSGPGGQSVNTTDSRVELGVDLDACRGLSDEQRRRILDRLGPSRSVVAAEHRSQYRNRVAARERLAELIRRAVAPPAARRRPTRPTRGSQARRLAAKRRRAATKSLRGRVRDE